MLYIPLTMAPGTTGRAVQFPIEDASGSPITGLTSLSAGLTANYSRDGGSAVAMNLVTIGFVQVDGTALPGIYNFTIPNAALAAGANQVSLELFGSGTMVPTVIGIQLSASASFPTNFSSLSIDASGRVDTGKISGTVQTAKDLGALSIDGSGRVDVAKIAGTTQTARDIGASVLLSNGTGTGQVSLSSGAIKIQDALKANTALANFPFVMVDSSGNPAAGLAVTATRSIDGAAFGACANAVTGIANGVYKIDLAAADLNGTTITLRFTATGARDTDIVLLTTP